MLEWVLKNIGVQDELLGRLDRATLALQRPGALWIGLALLVPVGWFIVVRQRRNLRSAPPLLRLALAFTRVSILGLLAIVLAGPYLKIDETVEKRPVVALVFDHSQSMQLPAGPFESDADLAGIAGAAGYQFPDKKVDAQTRKALNLIGRAKLSQVVVQADPKSFTGPLSEKYDVRFHSFARELASMGVDPRNPKLPEPPNPGGTASHLGEAIAKVLEDAAGRQVAGIVLFSDGESTGGRSPSEAAHASMAAGTPIFTVPAGSSNRLRDVSIVDVFTSGMVSVGDSARIAVVVESQGFDKRPVKVELRDGDALIDSKDVVLNDQEQQQVELSFPATEADKGQSKYLTVGIPPLPEEPEYLRANNADVALVRVSGERLKVLHIEGLPRWDFRFLKNAMRRDNGLGGRAGKEPDLVLESEWKHRGDADKAAALPGTVDQLAEYHVVILGDASPALLSPGFVKLLAEAVHDRGLGLLVEAGPGSMPHAFDERLLDLLPVKLRKSAGGLEAPVYRPFRLELSPEGATHEAMRLYDDVGRNQNTWGKMPPFYWCAAVERASPGATTLAWNPSVEGRYGKLPLIAHHFAGKGRVMFVGGDSTWLWRQNVGDRFFYKFWGQSLRFVARGDRDAKKSRIDVHPVRVQPGEPAEIELFAVDAEGAPLADDTLTIKVAGAGGAGAIDVVADPAVKGRYTGRYTPQVEGEHRLTYTPASGSDPVEAKVRVRVAPEELRRPNVNRPELERIATASGGRMVELTNLASILPQLKGEPKNVALRLDASLWDNWLTLSLLVALYSIDVGLRRLAGLS